MLCLPVRISLLSPTPARPSTSSRWRPLPKQGYNGDLTSREAGSVGGQMVKKMIQAYENSMK